MIEEYSGEPRKRIDRCFYCGDDSLELHRDHVKPVSYQSPARYYDERDTVPCCSECNVLLGDYPAFTLEERAETLVDKLSTKYRKVLKTNWTRSELDGSDIHGNLRSKIASNINVKEWVEGRLEKLAKVSISMYDKREVSHLRGLTTRSKVVVYHMLVDFLRGEGTIKDYVSYWAEYLEVPQKDVEKVINEKSHFDVAVTIKIDRGWPLDLTLRELRRIISRGSK